MKLLSIGEILWDVYEADSTLGGATLNLAAHYALQGGEASLATAIGDDELGHAAHEAAKKLGVNTDYISIKPDKITGQTLVSLDKNGIPRYNILTDTAYDYIDLPEVLSEKFDVVAFGTLALRDDYNRRMLKRLLDNNSFAEVFTDLNIRAPFYSTESIEFCLSNATIVKISDEEMPTVTKTLYGEEYDTLTATKKIASAYSNIKLLVITKGADGSFCYDTRDGKVYDCKAERATVVSSVGAGDSFGATFLYHYLTANDIAKALALASKVSAYVVSHTEAVPADMKDFISTIL